MFREKSSIATFDSAIWLQLPFCEWIIPWACEVLHQAYSNSELWETSFLGGFKKLFLPLTWKNVKFSTSWTAHMAITTSFRKNFQVRIALRGRGSLPRVKMSTRFRRENRQEAVKIMKILPKFPRHCCFSKRWNQGNTWRRKKNLQFGPQLLIFQFQYRSLYIKAYLTWLMHTRRGPFFFMEGFLSKKSTFSFLQTRTWRWKFMPQGWILVANCKGPKKTIYKKGNGHHIAKATLKLRAKVHVQRKRMSISQTRLSFVF